MTRYLQPPHLHPSSLQRVAARGNTWRMEVAFLVGEDFLWVKSKFWQKISSLENPPNCLLLEISQFFWGKKIPPKTPRCEVLIFLEIG